MAKLIARIAVEKTALHFDKGYDYLIPLSMEGKIYRGQRVTIPFGTYNHRRLGLVLEILEREDSETKGFKSIATIVDEKPLLNDELMKVLLYLKEYTFCSYFDALKAMLPSGIGILVGAGYSLCKDNLTDETILTTEEKEIIDYLMPKKKEVQEKRFFTELTIEQDNASLKALIEKGIVIKSQLDKRKTLDEKIAMLELSDNEISEDIKLTAKQKSVVAFLLENGTASLKEVCYYCGVTKAVTDKLLTLGVLQSFEELTYRNPYEDADSKKIEDIDFAVLSEAQQIAFDELKQIYDHDDNKQVLLYGVTGSGKTEVFLKLIQNVVAEGKKAMVLVPEISLTPQTVGHFHRIFGKQVAVMHSGLSMSERLDEWKRIKDGGADIVVGTRSAVFAPLKNIGLIVIDEEQEHTYKSENTPRFHARDVAKLRAKQTSAMLLLASATPSVESYHYAKTGKYHLVTLDKRFTGRELPDVYIVDLKEDAGTASLTGLSQRLTDELYINLKNNEQSILLLNRRGYTTTVKCGKCASVQYCPNCSISLTYHNANNRLMCHYCGYSADLTHKCECGSELVRYTGVGTQRLEEQVKALFPEARVLRMDMDTTMTKFAHEKKFEAFRSGEYDIMIGTQMVAKGLNFPRVTLVGVVTADQSLFAEDFRSLERSFALLTQVVGRCGRGELLGRAFVQTYSPDNKVIELASKQNYPEFFKDEIDFRRIGLYPPYCDIYAIGFVSTDEQDVRRSAKAFAQKFQSMAKEEYEKLPIRLLGPVDAVVFKVAGKYRCKLLLKCRNSAQLRELITRLLNNFYQDKQNKNTSVFIDTYYDNNF